MRFELRSPQGIFLPFSLLSWNTGVRTEAEQPSCDHEDRSHMQKMAEGKTEGVRHA